MTQDNPQDNQKEEIKEEKKEAEKNEPANLKECQQKLSEVLKQLEEYKEGWQRERAEFLNYRQEEMGRIEKERFSMLFVVMKDLLDVLDSLEFAEINFKKAKDLEAEKGIYLIKNQLLKILKDYGLKEIETKERKFDPLFDEAIDFEETESADEDGKIIEVIQKGYLLNNQLMRPNKVKIFKLKN